MKLLRRWALVGVAASLLWLIAIIGVRHGRDTPVLHTAAAATGHVGASRPGAGSVRLLGPESADPDRSGLDLQQIDAWKARTQRSVR